MAGEPVAGIYVLAEAVEREFPDDDLLHLAVATLGSMMVSMNAETMTLNIMAWERRGVQMGDWRLSARWQRGGDGEPTEGDAKAAEEIAKLEERFGIVPMHTLCAMRLLGVFADGRSEPLRFASDAAGQFEFVGRRLAPEDIEAADADDAEFYGGAIESWPPPPDFKIHELRFSIPDPLRKAPDHAR